MQQYRLVVILASVALMASSCSFFKVFQPTKAAVPTSIEQEIEVSHTPVLRTSVPEPPQVAGERPDISTLTGGRWVIAMVDTDTIKAEDDAPYIYFEAGTGRFFGSNGCNILNGNYLLRNDGRMVFSNVLSTMNYCPDDEYGLQISRYISDQAELYVDTQYLEPDTYLYLRTSNGNVVMVLRRHNMEFLNGNWSVKEINGEEINDEECNIFFDIAEHKVHGNTGCNYFNGDIYIDPARANALDLSGMATTRMACSKGDQEMQMMVALESTVSAVVESNNNTAVLLNENGNVVMKLRRIPMDMSREE